MQEPNISWYLVNDDGEEIPTQDFYLGDYKYGEYIDFNIRLWNNRWGEEDIEDAKDIIFELEFFNLEDSIILDDIVITENELEIDFFKEANKIKARLKNNLSGKKHSIIDDENSSNYTDVNVSIFVREGLSRSLKQMILGVDYSRGDM